MKITLEHDGETWEGEVNLDSAVEKLVDTRRKLGRQGYSKRLFRAAEALTYHLHEELETAIDAEVVKALSK